MNRRVALRSLLTGAAIVGLAGCASGGGVRIPTPFSRLGPVGGDNSPLSQAVWQKLRATPDVSASLSRLEVTSPRSGVIILKGRVTNENERFTIERIAGTVEGVEDVQSVLFVGG